MADGADDLDYSEQFNTTLSPREETKFQDWIAVQSKKTKREIGRDVYDYDLRGFWKRNREADLSDAHLSDTYKKPNHPTFSSESKYHGEEGLEGGQWERNPDKSWKFTPGPTNLSMHGAGRLRRYFDRVEAGNELVLPTDTIAGPYGR